MSESEKPIRKDERARVLGEVLSDEAVEAAAIQPSLNAGSEDASYWHQLDDEEKAILRNEARSMLEAALATLTPSEDAAEEEASKDAERARLERALRRQHIEAHGSTCECRAFEVEQVIAEGSGAPLPEEAEARIAELEATNSDGFDEVIELREKLEAMTNARDLCKRQAAEANKREQQVRQRLGKVEEAWDHERQRADAAESRLEPRKLREDRGSSDVGTGRSSSSIAAQPLPEGRQQWPDCNGAGVVEVPDTESGIADCPGCPRCQPARPLPEPPRCGGEATNPAFFGSNSEDEFAVEDGFCRGCPDCEPEAESVEGSG